MKPKAILFDVDGTILDTHEYIYQAFEHSLGMHHKPLTREEIQIIMGKPLEECYRILTELEDISELAESHKLFQANNAFLAKPFPNTIKTLEKIKKNGMLIGAVTTRAKESATESLDVNEVMPYINHFVAFEDVVNPKPDPEGIHQVLNYFGIDPSDAIMVGDSDVDVFAGKNAGVSTVGVTYGFHGENIVEADPDFVIDDIQEVLAVIEDL